MTTTSRLRCPPRFGTPRNPDRATIGPQLGEVARRLGFHPMPHQQHVFDVIGELDDDGSLWYDEVDYYAPRRSGKTAVVVPAVVHRATAMARRFGPQRAAYTAQSREAARERLEKDFAAALRSPHGRRWFRELENPKAKVQRANEWKLSLNNGHEHILIGKSVLQITAPTRTAGHGDDLDLGLIDELFAHLTDDVETAMAPAMATRHSPQLWRLSAAGDAKSAVLWRKVLAGRAACERGEHGKTAYFEWSADDDDDPSDPAVWARAHPALGLTVREAFLRGKWEAAVRDGSRGVAKFRRSYLGQWPDKPLLVSLAGSAWPAGAWQAVCSPDVAPPSAGLVFGVWVDRDRTRAAICVAGGGGTGSIVDERPGTGWVVDELVRVASTHRARVAVVGKSPAGSLIASLEQRSVPVLSLTGDEYVTACQWFYDAVLERRVLISRDERLDAAVGAADRKKTGQRFVWERRKDVDGDVSSLQALTVAMWKACTANAVDMAGQVW